MACLVGGVGGDMPSTGINMHLLCIFIFKAAFMRGGVGGFQHNEPFSLHARQSPPRQHLRLLHTPLEHSRGGKMFVKANNNENNNKMTNYVLHERRGHIGSDNDDGLNLRCMLRQKQEPKISEKTTTKKSK